MCESHDVLVRCYIANVLTPQSPIHTPNTITQNIFREYPQSHSDIYIAYTKMKRRRKIGTCKHVNILNLIHKRMLAESTDSGIFGIYDIVVGGLG